MKFFTNRSINFSAFFLNYVIDLVVPVNSSSKYCCSDTQPCRFDQHASFRLTNALFISSRCRSIKFQCRLGTRTVIGSLLFTSFTSDHSPSIMHVCAFMIGNVCCPSLQKITYNVPVYFNKSSFTAPFFFFSPGDLEPLLSCSTSSVFTPVSLFS
jgi:hypothetical protein